MTAARSSWRCSTGSCPGLGRAFDEAVADIRSVAQLRALEAAIERGDVEGAFQALRLGAEFFAPLDRQIEQAFRAGAVYQLGLLPKRRPGGSAGLVVRFDQRHPRAEAWSRENAAALVTEILEDTRTMVRQTMTEALEANRPPRSTALDITGRMDGNSRKGGLLGLTSGQAEYVRRARAELADPERAAEYLRRTRRDRRLDATVKRAAREGRRLSAAEIDRIAGRYADRLLALRGEAVARTESLRALNAGRAEGVMQMIERGDVPADAVTLVWQATPSARTRDSHRMMHGQEVGFGEAFTSPVTGARMLYPGDGSMGAPASELINCRCSVRTRVDYTKMAR